MSFVSHALTELRRDAVPLRIAFLRAPTRNGGAGPLASFVRGRREAALDLLLAAHTLAPLSHPEPTEASSTQWAEAIGLKDRPGNRALVSRAWTWLETQQLVRTRRRGRIRTIEILREDGSGREWEHPAEDDVPYFKLDHRYWHANLPRELGLQAKAMLLIGISLSSRGEPFFELPASRASTWYGLSSPSIAAGLRELRQAKILRAWVETRETKASPLGRTYDRRYALNSFDSIVWRRSPTRDADMLEDLGPHDS